MLNWISEAVIILLKTMLPVKRLKALKITVAFAKMFYIFLRL